MALSVSGFESGTLQAAIAKVLAVYQSPSWQQPRAYSALVVIRGTVKQQAGVKLAVNRVVEFITGDSHHVPMVSLSLDVSPQHHRTLIGNQGGNIRAIMERSSTTYVGRRPWSLSREGGDVGLW